MKSYLDECFIQKQKKKDSLHPVTSFSKLSHKQFSANITKSSEQRSPKYIQPNILATINQNAC